MATTTLSNLNAPSAFSCQNKNMKDSVVTVVELESSDEECERTFHNTDSAYVLPNDNVEHQRLELQHRLMRQIMGNKILHAPLEATKVRKTLDIGCGTGAVTHETATLFPAAQAYGADLSPVPQVRPKLPNITYVQGNIMEIEDPRFEKESFDLIFSRLLVLGMANWEAYINRCVSLTRPGGWLEMHDFSNAVHHVPSHISSLTHLRPHDLTLAQLATNSHPSDAYHLATPWLWETTLGKLLALKNVDLYCGPNIPFLFQKAGLVDISIRRYMVPYSRWEGLTKEEKEMADYLESFIRDMVPICLRKAGENAGPEYKEEVEAALEDAKRYHEAYGGGRNFLWMYVVCGRKPE